MTDAGKHMIKRDLDKLFQTGVIIASDYEEAIKNLLPHPSPAGKKSGAGTVKAAGQKQLTV